MWRGGEGHYDNCVSLRVCGGVGGVTVVILCQYAVQGGDHCGNYVCVGGDHCGNCVSLC